MRRESYGTDNDDRLVFALGWGNEPETENVQWLVDRLVDAGYRVDAFEIPPTSATTARSGSGLSRSSSPTWIPTGVSRTAPAA